MQKSDGSPVKGTDAPQKSTKDHLVEKRQQVASFIGQNVQTPFSKEQVQSVKEYFDAFKTWKTEDRKTAFDFANKTVGPAVTEGRLTMRETKSEAEVYTTLSGAKYDARARLGIKERQNPDNYLGDQKHKKGLYPLSAVLFNPEGLKGNNTFQNFDAEYQKQSFKSVGLSSSTLTEPLPYQEDLQVFDNLFKGHRKNPNLEFQTLRGEMKANITRPDLAATNDMAVMMAKVKNSEGGDTYKFGWKNDDVTTMTRRKAALHYQTDVSLKKGTSRENNEVTVKYRKF